MRQVSCAPVSTLVEVGGLGRSAGFEFTAAAAAAKCSTCFRLGQAGRARFSSSASRASHSAWLTCALSMMVTSSRARSSGMLPTAMPPALTTANQQAASMGELAPRSSTRLPGTRPRSSTSTRAMRLACACRSA